MNPFTSLLNGFCFFVGVGFAKAIVEPVAKKFFQTKVLKYAPVMLQMLDERVPRLLGKASGKEIEQMVKQKFEELTGESWGDDDVDSLFRLYDVRIAADKALKNEQENSNK
jgi:hypothetical protein